MEETSVNALIPPSIVEPSMQADSAMTDSSTIVDEGRTQICIEAKQLPEAVAEAVKALTAYNSPPLIFMYNRSLVRLAGQGTCDPNIELAVVGVPELQAELTYAARWFERTEKGDRPIYPPSIMARDILHRSATSAPRLREVVRVPVFGTGWQLLDVPGFYAADELLYEPNHQQLPRSRSPPVKPRLPRRGG